MFDIIKILGFLKKTFTFRDILLIIAIITLYLATRLINLDQFPIFSDEGIYIRWAKVAWHDASWRFISLTDGKQPLQTWGTIPFLKIFPDNALLAGRLFAVATGLGALSGIFSILLYLFNKRTAFIGALLYIFTPYFLFYDRMALVDSGVNAFFIWILFFSILLAKTQRLDMSLLFGFIGGMALLAKSSVRIFLGLATLAPIFFIERNLKKFFTHLLNFFVLYIFGILLSLLIYNIQRLSPFFHYVAEKNKTFIVTFEEFIKSPFAHFFNNIKLVPYYVLSESGYVLIFFGIVGLVYLFKKNKRLAIYLLLWILIPYIIVAFVSKVLFPRYIIFFASLFLILAAYFISQLKNRPQLLLTLLIFLLSVGYFNYTIIADYKNIPFPPIDRGQYIEGWPAGWGIKEIVSYAREKSKEKPVIILAEGSFGLAGDVLDTHTKPNDKIAIRGYWPLSEKELYENQKDLGENYVYVVLSHKNDYPKEWPLKLIKKYEKPNTRLEDKSTIFLLELTK